LIRLAEEKRLALLAAAAKKNDKGAAKKKGAKEKEEEKVVEAPKPVEIKQNDKERELDLNDSKDFANAI
jgi:hypothetical protein